MLVIGVLIRDEGREPGRELEGVLPGDMSMSSVCRESETVQMFHFLHTGSKSYGSISTSKNVNGFHSVIHSFSSVN